MLAVWPRIDVIQDSRTWPDSKLDRSSVITRSTGNYGLAVWLYPDRKSNERRHLLAVCLRSCGQVLVRPGNGCVLREEILLRSSFMPRCQDTSAPNNWCRSVRTLRHQFLVGAWLSHGHFGLLPNCMKTKGNGQSKTWRDRRHSQ